MLHTRERI